MKYKLKEDKNGTITDKRGKRFKIKKIEPHIDIDKFINTFLILIDLMILVILLFAVIVIIGIIVGWVCIKNGIY